MFTRDRYLLHAIIIFLVIAGFSGCSNKNKTADSNKTPTPSLQDLAARVNTLEASQSLLQASVDAIDNQAAYITTDDEAYGITRNKFGSFIVSCKGATPYLDGYKVKIWIGNLTAITYKGFKVHIEYGENIFINTLTKDIDSTATLYPGRYTAITAVLAPAKPKDVKGLQVSLELNEVSLYQP